MNVFKKVFAGAALAAVTIIPTQAQSNIEVMATTDETTSRIRPNLFYQVPGGIKGYTFMEFYQDGQEYLVKSSLTKEIKYDIGMQLQFINKSSKTDQAGLGLEYKLPTGENTTAKVKAIPVYMGFDGKYVDNKAIMGFYVNQKVYVPILNEMNIVAFGEINVAAESGPSWEYGELHVQKTLDDFIIGIGVDFRGHGDMTPDANVSVKLGYVFGQD